MPEGVKKFESQVFPARVVRHDTKSATKDGVGVLKVTLEIECTVGSEAIKTAATFAFRELEANGIDWQQRLGLNDDFEVVIRPKKKD